MIHERDDHYEGHDEGEYHFSDDQANYEMEPDLSIKTPEAGAATAPQASVTAKIPSNLKRPLIGLGVFFALIFLVYKILAPSASPPVAEFSQGVTKIPVAPRPVMEVAKVQPATVETAAPAPAAVTPPPIVQVAPAPVVTQPMVAQPAAAPQPVAAPAPMQQAQTPPPAAYVPEQPVQQAQPAQVAQPAMQPTTVVPTEMQPSVSGVQQADVAMQSVRLQQTTQKLSDLETQNTALQGKVQDMSMRLASMEATITRLGKIMQESRSPRSEAPSVAPAQPARPMMQPRSTYSVQAIIPGRAWLKSDSGDTVTVAEGDVIRDFGRVMKIDPYDGIVEIDAEGRTITLSYGINGD